ncbi:MAG: hypothetical protein DWQ05_14655 [Calditrichaeota bacterium]|nr:MAG: hypothetical protein DWQ05_14655 [Calditrichota bacterium]
MSNLAKAILGGLALFMALGGPHLFKKNPDKKQPAQVQKQRTEEAPSVKTPAPAKIVQNKNANSETFLSQPRNQIFSLDWLEKNGQRAKQASGVRITYYLLANSQRCHVDSLSQCIRDKIAAKNIDAMEFQYTYFLDRVMIAGSGVLEWEGQRYVTRYDLLRKAGWNKDDYEGKNNYTCRNFKFNNKNALPFIASTIKMDGIFTKWQDHPTPNGRTFSGQQAEDWRSVSVNLKNFPVSVPDQNRRKSLAAKFKGKNIKGPFARSFIVIKTNDGKQFLTEAMDTGSGVKENWIDWRIGNSSTEIKYFLSLGSIVDATCYTFNDPNITLEKVLQNSRNFTAK